MSLGTYYHRAYLQSNEVGVVWALGPLPNTFPVMAIM